MSPYDQGVADAMRFLGMVHQPTDREGSVAYVRGYAEGRRIRRAAGAQKSLDILAAVATIGKEDYTDVIRERWRTNG